MCPTTSQNPRWHPPWLSDACATRKDSESERLFKKNPETDNNTLDCKPLGRAVLPGSLNPPPLARVPFPSKSFCFVSTCVSSDNLFPSVRQDPLSDPGRGPPSCNRWTGNRRNVAHLVRRLKAQLGERGAGAPASRAGRGLRRWAAVRAGPAPGRSVPEEAPLCRCCSHRDALTAGPALPCPGGVGTVLPLFWSQVNFL